MATMGFQTVVFGPYDIPADADALAYHVLQNPTGYAYKVVAARANAKAAVSAVDTNYNTLELQNGSVVVASLANGPVAGGVAIPIGSSAGAAFTLGTGSLVVGSGEFLWLDVTKTGTGQAIAGLSIEVDIEFIKTP